MVGMAQVALGIYGVLLIVGGVLGKIKGNSSASLVAGSFSGAAALTGLWKSFNDPMIGFMIGSMVGLLLTGIFVSRFVRSREFMPAGLILVLSLIVGLLCMMAGQEVEEALQPQKVIVQKKGPKAVQRTFGPNDERSSTQPSGDALQV
jgi:uncharacterized membrane protein (UPF0136 family)